jgi:hypothetical protein
MSLAMENGNGGDNPENDIEAILFAISKCPDCGNIIHVADNNATPRDLSLLYKVNKPVRVIVCGVKGAVNPELLNIAYRTGGSLHTIEEDIRNLAGMSIGERVTIGGYSYRLTSYGFVSEH